jgi:serine/threonine protein phosphatase PrpC
MKNEVVIRVIEFAILSKAGDRNINEDYVGNSQKDGKQLFCLADGLGGHGKGEVASELVVTHALAAFAAGDSENLLSACFAQAQERLLAEQIKENAKNEMKTTLALLLIQEDRASWGHVGDSRVYLFRKHKVLTRTLDHSVPQMLVATGEIKEKDIRFHEDRNRLIRVMGMEWNVPRYELSAETPLQAGDALLLCSDGFWEWLDEKEMSKSLKKAPTPDAWLGEMEMAVLTNGRGKNMDNYSAIAVLVK